jgi:hypothetical protein
MALTPTEEALVRQLLDEQAALLSLAGSEATIISKLGATKVTLADLVAASSLADADLLLTRQGVSDKSVRADILAAYVASELNLTGYAPIASPTFTGDPKAPTPAQFDTDTSLATTAFVKSSQGNFAGLNSYNASATLPLSDIGKLLAFYGSTAAQTLTLPAAGSVPVGYSYVIVNQASVPVTVKGNGAENISTNALGLGQKLSNTTVLSPGDSLTLSSNGASQWNAFGMSQPFYGYMLVQDEKPNGTGGGTSVATINTRVLNTVVANTIVGASLASNQVTLPAGTYRYSAICPCGPVDGNRAYLWNVTDSAVVNLGTSNDGLANIQSSSMVRGRFTTTSTKVFELRHWMVSAIALGLGYNASAGNNEVYSQLEIIKEA